MVLMLIAKQTECRPGCTGTPMLGTVMVYRANRATVWSCSSEQVTLADGKVGWLEAGDLTRWGRTIGPVSSKSGAGLHHPAQQPSRSKAHQHPRVDADV